MDMKTARPAVEESEGAHFNRPPRIQRTLPVQEITLPAPPVPGKPPHQSLLPALLPGLGMTFSMGLMSAMNYSQNGNLLTLLPSVMMGVLSLGTSVFMYREQHQTYKRNIADENERFERILEAKMGTLNTARAEERRIRLENDPSLDQILQLVEADDLRLWERRPEDPDFVSVRLGVGELFPSVTLKLPELDPLAPRQAEVMKLYSEHELIKDVPITINLREAGSLGIWGGNRSLVLETVHSMLTHLTAHHAPHELRIALLCDGEQAVSWDWLKWVRHAESLQPDLPGRSVAIGREAARVLLNDLAGIVRPRISADEQEQGAAGVAHSSDELPVYPVHYLLIVDHYRLIKGEATADYLMSNARIAGVTILDIESNPRDVPDNCKARLEIFPTGRAEFATTGPAPIVHRCHADRIESTRAGELARQMTNKHQAQGTTTVADIPTSVRLVDALFARDSQRRVGVDEIDILKEWGRRPPDWTWGILLGWKQNNEPVWLNLLEDKDGPHGLAAGTTGAGKSVLLQSMILSLALTHSPEEINFVLVDFKGGSTAEAFRHLPHTISVITNLQGRLVDRSLAILKAEARRRQLVLQEAEVKDIATYHARRKAKNLPPLPRLIVIIDEFAEMAKEMPTFMDEVNSIAAIGRSLGVHLILATQKPGGVVPDKVWANLKFRVCLRVATTSDSRDMLGVGDAALLPSSLPGRAYVRVGSERLELFQSANTAYPYRPESVATDQKSPVVVRRAGLSSEAPQPVQKEDSSRAIAGRTELEVVVERIAQAAPPVPRWPDQLSPSLPLEQIWQTYAFTTAWQGWEPEESLTFTATRDTLAERMRVAVGLLDDPYTQTQRPLWVDLNSQHYMIVGAPRSGRSTLLQTILRALLVNTTPDELNISLLDFGGQNLIVFQEAPHVANVLNVNTQAHLRRFLARIGDDLDHRAELRATQRLDQIPRALYVIDGMAELRSLYPDEIDGILGRVAREGLALGVHLLVTADQVMSIPLRLRSNFLGRLALHLSDPADYVELVGRVSGALPAALPGRGLVRENPSEPVLEFQVGWPISQKTAVDGSYIELLETDLFAGLHRLSQNLSQAWPGERPEPIQILPTALGPSDAPATVYPGGQTWGQIAGLPKLVIGQGNRRLDWLEVDYNLHGPHFIVCGPLQSGKTNLLREWVWNLCERYSPADVQCTLIGMRNRSLSSLASLPHVQKVVDSEFRLDEVLNRLKALADARHKQLKKMVEENPDGDVNAMAETLGPIHLVVVDDFDPVRFTRERQNALMDFCQYGRDTRTFVLLAGASSDLLEFSDLLKFLKRGRSAFLLQPGDIELRVVDVRLSAAAMRQEYPVGRGYLVLGNQQELAQTIHIGEDYLVERCNLLSRYAQEHPEYVPTSAPAPVADEAQDNAPAAVEAQEQKPWWEM
ncbi:MAG TPA: FtsK/SpoIIIE domain-containing protein [Anaerolineae bacterium]|nr:FtsK/SpoIIIE domain-containing protein [Anaerolineae bacterium]